MHHVLPGLAIRSHVGDSIAPLQLRPGCGALTLWPNTSLGWLRPGTGRSGVLKLLSGVVEAVLIWDASQASR